VLGDSVRYLVGASVIVGLGVALGYRPEAGLPGIVAAVALVVVFAFGLSWSFAAVGLLMRAPNAVSSAGSMVLFPLVFLSNVFVEPETLPGWLAAFVDVSPISHLVTAARRLMDGTVPGLELTVSLGTAALLTALFAPLTTYLYGRK
jgi:ABC-2 type transport system permease protein